MSLDLKFKPFFLNITDLGLFKESIFCIFSKHAPIRKYLRANEATFMSKEFPNAIMRRSIYRSKFLNGKSQTSRKIYNIQGSLYKKILRKARKLYFESLNTKQITDNRTFWQTNCSSFHKEGVKRSKDYS